MTTFPKRLLWWGVAVIIVGALAHIVSTSAALQSSMISEPVGNSLYYWAFSPALIIIQNAAFPLGAALIGASLVIRYLKQSQSALPQQQAERDEP